MFGNSEKPLSLDGIQEVSIDQFADLDASESSSDAEDISMTRDRVQVVRGAREQKGGSFYQQLEELIGNDKHIPVTFADKKMQFRDAEDYFIKAYNQNKSIWREIGKYLFALITLPLLAFGALRFLFTTRVIKPGELMVKKDFRGNYTVLPQGRHSLFPWESYVTSNPISVRKARFELGNEVIQRVGPGELGAVIHRGTAEIQLLEPGTYKFDMNEYEVELPKPITVRNSSSASNSSSGKTDEFHFGGKNGVIILNVRGNEVAVCSNQITGKNKVLGQGIHVFSAAENIIYGPKDRVKDVVELGPIQIITARAGFKGIYYRKKDKKDAALHVIDEDTRVVLDTSKGDRFHHLISTQVRSEEVVVDHAVTADGFEYKVKANITYHVADVEKAARKIDNANEGSKVAKGNDQIKAEVHEFSKRIISEIILKHARHDIQPFAAEMLAGDKTNVPDGHADEKLKAISKEIKDKLKKTLEDWGVELHQDIEITDLEMKDKKQKSNFNKQVEKIQEMVFRGEASRREAAFIETSNKNMVATAKAKADAKRLAVAAEVAAPIDAVREALKKSGMDKRQIASYIAQRQVLQALTKARGAFPVPVGLDGNFTTMGPAPGGGLYQYDNGAANSGDAASRYLATANTHKQLALVDAMNDGAKTGPAKTSAQSDSEEDDTSLSDDDAVASDAVDVIAKAVDAKSSTDGMFGSKDKRGAASHSKKRTGVTLTSNLRDSDISDGADRQGEFSLSLSSSGE